MTANGFAQQMDGSIRSVGHYFLEHLYVIYALLAVTALFNILNFVQLIVMHLSVKREEKEMATRPMELQGSARQEAVEEENYMYGQIGAKPPVEQEENTMYGKVGTEKNGYAKQPKIETRLPAPGTIEQEENYMYGVITPDTRPATTIAEQEEENCLYGTAGGSGACLVTTEQKPFLQTPPHVVEEGLYSEVKKP